MNAGEKRDERRERIKAVIPPLEVNYAKHLLHKEDREYFYLITKGGMEALATLVVNIEPYIRTNNKKE